jgi:hypothetical protein
MFTQLLPPNDTTPAQQHLPSWTAARPSVPAGSPVPRVRRLQLAPGIWITQCQEWLPVSALDIGADVPLEVDEVQVWRRSLPFVEWHERAACRGMDAATLFGADPDERPTLKLSELARARAICRTCPVAHDCLQHALTLPEKFGVWAGRRPCGG